VLLGPKWTEAIVPLQLLTLVMPLRLLIPFVNTAAQGFGRADIAMKQVAAACIVMPIAFWIGTRWGLVGLSAAWVAAFPFVFLYSVGNFAPLIGLRVRDVLAALSRPALAASAMYGVVVGARALLAGQLGSLPLLGS